MPETALTAAPVESAAPVEPVETTQAPPAESTPVVVPPPVAAAPVAVPVAPTAEPAPATLTPEQQQYILALERDKAQFDAQTRDAELQRHIVAEVARLESKGYTPEQALEIANEKGEAAKREFQQGQNRRNQIAAAFDVAGKFKVDPRMLMDLPSLGAMEQAAQAATQQGTQAAEMARIRAENAELRKKLAPPQTFASGAAGGVATTSGPVTPARLAAMTPAEYAEWRKTGLK